MIADSGTSFIIGPTSILDAIAEAIGGVSSNGRYQVENKIRLAIYLNFITSRELIYIRLIALLFFHCLFSRLLLVELIFSYLPVNT